jgi:TPR repeat protein
MQLLFRNKFIILFATIHIVAHKMYAQHDIRSETAFQLYEKSMLEDNYTQAYFHLKYLEKHHKDYAYIKYHKLQCLIHLADFNNKDDVFVAEVKECIEILEDAYNNNKLDDIIDLEWVYQIQLNFLKEGSLYRRWSMDEEYRRGMEYLEKKNYSKALQYLNFSTSKNNALAHYYLGVMYDNGWGTDKDIEMANSHYESAIEYNFGLAYFALAKNMLNDGDASLPISSLTQAELQIFKEYLEAAYKLNINEAASLLGEYYLHMAQNQKELYYTAYNWYAIAASKGDMHAMIKLAEMHCKGIGAIQSHKEASYWIEQLSTTQQVSNQTITTLKDCIKDL